MSVLSAGACCCRSETIDGHFRRAPGICHCWSCLQVGLHTQHSSSACTGHHSAALQTFHLKNPPQWSVLMEHVPTGQPMAVHVEVCCFPVCCSSTAACQEVCQLACLLQPVSCLPRVLQPAKSSVSQSVRSVLRSWSSLPSVRQQPPRLPLLTHPCLLACRLSGSNYILTFALSAIPASAALLLVTTAFGKGATAADAANKKKRKGVSSFAWLKTSHILGFRSLDVRCDQHRLGD